MNYTILEYVKSTPLNNTGKSILAELLREKTPVDIIYTDEAGEWAFIISARKEKFENWWLGGFDTLALAKEFANKFELKICNIYDPYEQME